MIQKTKILIVVPSYRNGGTVSSLKNILPSLKNNYNVDVFAITPEGPNKEDVAKYANIIGIMGENTLKEGQLFRIKIILIIKKIKKILCIFRIDISSIVFRKVVSKLKKNNYSIVIAFQEGQATKFVSYFKNAKKVAWVRCDYKNMLKMANIKPEKSLYQKFNKVVCVSNYTKENFERCIPKIKDVICLHNIIRSDEKIRKSKEIVNNFYFNDNEFVIISVGRIDEVKRFSYIPEIVYKIKKKYKNFMWYIIGDGKTKEKELINNNIIKYKVDKNIILLGEINNPYPYIKRSNILVSTSFSEACPNVINEAKILHIPVVATNFGSVYEFIEDGYNGLISPIENIDEKILSLIEDKKLYARIKNNISNFKYDNDEILKILYRDILN